MFELPIAAPVTLKWLFTRMNKSMFPHISHNLATDLTYFCMGLKEGFMKNVKKSILSTKKTNQTLIPDGPFLGGILGQPLRGISTDNLDTVLSRKKK